MGAAASGCTHGPNGLASEDLRSSARPQAPRAVGARGRDESQRKGHAPAGPLEAVLADRAEESAADRADDHELETLWPLTRKANRLGIWRRKVANYE